MNCSAPNNLMCPPNINHLVVKPKPCRLWLYTSAASEKVDTNNWCYLLRYTLKSCGQNPIRIQYSKMHLFSQ